MGIRYAVLGAGRQGTAAAYDLARFGEAEAVLLADADTARASEAARRVNELTRRDIARPLKVDVRDEGQVAKALADVQAVMSAVPYTLNLGLTRAAIASKTHFCDLGGNTEIVLEQRRFDADAKKAGVTVVPDCGLAPGLGNIFATYVIKAMDTCRRVKIRCGGLPQTPRPPLDYKLVFNIAGLTNEYFGKAVVLRNGKIAHVDTFSELEELDFPAPVGRCEAFVTSGGTSTVPITFEGQVEELDYKTVRYRGHFEKFKVLLDLGLLDLTPVDVGDATVVPRKLFHRVAAPRLEFPQDKDLVVLRCEGEGVKDGKPIAIKLDLLDLHDDPTGFTAMERTTGFPAAQVLIELAHGRAPAGVIPLEAGAVDPAKIVNGLAARGIKVTETITRPIQ